jgi:type I restriction enzyme S subunit
MTLNDLAEDGQFCDGDWIEKKDQNPNGAVRLIQLADIGEGKFKDKSDRFITEEKAAELKCTFLEKGDILVARLPEPLGRACIFPMRGKYITAVDIAIVRIKNPHICVPYVMHMINSSMFRRQIKNYETGTTRKRISRKNLAKITFELPTFEEQERIVARIEELFSELDKAVETLKTTKEQLAVYRQAVLKEAFEGITEKVPIRDVASLVTSGSRGWAKYYSDHGARFIRITDLTRDKICLKNDNIQYVDLPSNAEGKRSLLLKNDVLVSITADLGSIALVPSNVGEAYINQHIAMIRFKNAEQGEYMAWYLKSDLGQKDLLRNKRGGGKLGLGLDDIRDTPVPVVSDENALKTVQQIESRLSVCDSIEQTVDTALQQAETMRQSILKQAFEGRLV